MSDIEPQLLEELVTFNNEINCVKDTIGTVHQSKLLIMSNVENGSSNEELIEPMKHLFQMTKKPHTDIEYIKRQRPKMEVNITESANDINIYDTDSFLKALVPDQSSLIHLIEEQCNIHPEFISLVDKLHLLNTACTNNICSGKLLASTRFLKRDNHDVVFPIAHPPFVYELDRILKLSKPKHVQSYLTHLKKYLTNKIENIKCILCLTYDFYSLDISSMKNFRLLFLENINPLANDMMSVDFLYETNIENYNKSDQCFLFEKLISDIVLIPFEGDSNSNRQYFVRFIGFKHPKLYF